MKNVKFDENQIEEKSCDNIEKEDGFIKAENEWMKDQNLLNEVKETFTKHGYDFDIFSKFFTNNL